MKSTICTPVWRFFSKHSFVKKHLIHLSALIILSAALAGVISYFHAAISGEEIVVSSFSFFEAGSNHFRVTGDSYVAVHYIPGEADEIKFFLTFENLGEKEVVGFNIVCNGEMKNKASLSRGVTEVDRAESEYETIHFYAVDFRSGGSPVLIEDFSCNLFEDKTGGVRLWLFLYDRNNLLSSNNIRIYFGGIDEFDLEYSFPKPEEESPHLVSYVYKSNDESFQEGIVLRGNNPNIQRKLQEIYFKFGVWIAILVSSLVALGVEVIRDVKIEPCRT